MNEFKEITLIITSCNRLQLLKTTIKSFEKYNTYPIKEAIIIEDSGKKEVYEELRKEYGQKYKILFNQPPLKQIRSIDRAYKEVKTDYIFHCEDDWQFYRTGFIEDSIAILEHNPNIKQVGLRSIHHDILVHHTTIEVSHIPKLVAGIKVYEWKLIEKFKEYDWVTFSFNPGLLRKKDYDLIGSYESIGTSEASISLWYKKHGFYSVILENDSVKHLGWENSSLGHYTNKYHFHIRIRNFFKAFLNLFGKNFSYS